MAISSYSSKSVVFDIMNFISGFAFKKAVSEVEIVNLSNLCACFGLRQDKSAHLSRLECLSPHDMTC